MSVLLLEEEPLVFFSLDSHQKPKAFELGSSQVKLDGALSESLCRVGFRPHTLVGSAIPDDDLAGSIFSRWNDPLEIEVFQGMIFHMDGQPFLFGVE